MSEQFESVVRRPTTNGDHEYTNGPCREGRLFPGQRGEMKPGMLRLGMAVLGLALAVAVAGCQGAATPGAATPTTIALPDTPATARGAGTPGVSALATRPAAAATEPPAPASTVAVTPATTGGGSDTGSITRSRSTVPRIMAIGARTTIALRSSPAGGALLSVPGSDVLWAEGRSRDGNWLRVAYGDHDAHAWVAKGDVALMGDAQGLPVTADGADSGRPLPAPTAAAPVAGAAATSARLSGQVSGDQLNVRAGPGTDRQVVGVLRAGTAVTLTARSADNAWVALTWGGGQGWVAARYITTNGDVQSLPVTERQPAATPATGRASGSGGSGKIAFQAGSGGDIYLINGSGSGLQRVASGMDPVFSPDGNRLAYTRWDSPTNGVYVLNLLTGQESRVAGATRPRGPAWSPDGTRLVFSHVLRTDKCTETPLGCLTPQQVRLIFRGQDCVELPRLGKICLSAYPVRNIDITVLTQVTLADGQWLDLPAQQGAQSPQWRPGQNELLYRGSRGLQIVTPPSGGQTTPDEATRPLVDDVLVNSPAWSPDGQRIAAQARVHDHWDIVTYDAAGGSRTALTQRAFLADHPVNNVAPAWSPDGQTVVFLTDRDGGWRMYAMNADGSDQRPFLPDVLGKISFRYDYAAERMLSWSR